MMKKIAIIGSILLSISAFAQDFIAENIEHKKVLYRGYENKLNLGPMGCLDEGYQIEPINCTISKLDPDTNENLYIVKVNRGAKNVQINLLSEGVIVDSAVFVLKNLPVATLYWGKNQSGSNFSDSREIVAKYSSDIPLESNFEIVSWECQHKDELFTGSGNLMSPEMLAYTRSLPTGESILIKIKVKNEGGITSIIKGTWHK